MPWYGYLIIGVVVWVTLAWVAIYWFTARRMTRVMTELDRPGGPDPAIGRRRS